MRAERQILARALLLKFDDRVQKVCENNPEQCLIHQPTAVLQSCKYKDALQTRDLAPLYLGPDPSRELDTPQFAAFESVRSFFEQLGAAYHADDFNDQDAFEAFSLPSESYWAAAISGWRFGVERIARAAAGARRERQA